MRILRVRLRNYRGVEELDVQFASAGVTVIQGPNESGKSSLVEAMGVIFDHLDSSSKQEVKSIKPVHRDAGAEVELEVECGDYAFTYRKRFHKKPETILQVRRPRPESLTGREAHERVMKILEETVDVGLWRALRIQQGSGIEQADLADQTSLSKALDRAAGGSASGEYEESLFQSVREEFLRYHTEGGKPRKDIEEAQKRAVEAQRAFETLQGKLETVIKDVETSSVLERNIAKLTEEEARLLKTARKREEDWQAISRRKTELEGLEERLKAAQAEKRSDEAKVKARQEKIQAVEQARKEMDGLKDKLDEERPALEAAQKNFGASEVSLDATRRRHCESSQMLEARRGDYELFRARLDLILLEERCFRVEKAVLEAREAEDFLETCRIDEGLLKEIEEAHIAVERARSRLEAAGATVEIEALDDIAPLVDGTDQLQARGERRKLAVPEALELTFPGVARLYIRSGAGTAPAAGKLAKEESHFASVCRKAGVTSLEAARGENERRKDAERVRRRKDEVLQENLRDLSPDALRRKIAALKASVEGSTSLRSPAPPSGPDLESAKSLLAEAERIHKLAEEEAGRLEKAKEHARVHLEALEKAAEEVKVRLKVAGEKMQGVRSALEDARKELADAMVASKFEHADLKAQEISENASEARHRLEAEEPERVEDLARNARESLKKVQDEKRSSQDQFIDINARLNARAEEGLAELLESARAQLERARADLGRLIARAQAARLLHDTLLAERDKARRAYVAPFKERIERLGRYVFGESFSVEVNEELSVVNRTQAGITVPFKDLSVGAQEQIAVIARLACAMTISGNGGGPVVLDDALGYSDPLRLEGMGAVLARSAREAQVIVLTCMPERYRHVGGAHVVRLG